MRTLTVLTAAALSTALAAPALALNTDAASTPKLTKDHHASQPSIVSIATGDETFSTLVTALQAAELVDALSGDGPFTVFAPTNDAFAAVGEDTLNSLLQPENRDQLTSILTYHVVQGEYFAEEVAPGSYELATLQGDTVSVVVGEDGSVMVDGAHVIAADVDASNGVVHVIDSVIMPE
ncbi:fasciclin domain-containing protein [Oceanicaulis sp. LC35]|uniref:fasciclin domain-containing protein n=1 Tax=Oceanicaulis sp. LC35 TaxID=3349635 RepID=UPI003F87B4DC